MKKKVEQDGHAQFLRNLRKFRRKFRKFRTCPEVPDITEKFTKSKLKIKYFKMLLQFLSMESMMIKMKTMKINCMRKKTNNQFKDNDSYHTQECTKAFNATIRRGVTTRSCLANFCESYSFVSSLEPLRVNQALEDLNGSWMIRSLW